MLRDPIATVSEQRDSLVGESKYDKSILILLNIVIIIPFIALLSVFFPITEFISGSNKIYSLHPLWMLIYLILGTLLMGIFHELLHGKAAEYLIQDIKIKYGATVLYRVVPVFYTNFTGFLHRNQFVVIALVT